MKRLVSLLLRLLPASDRDYVFGDLVELGVESSACVRSILVLVCRRQMLEWLRPEPWLALVSVSLLAGHALSRALASLSAAVQIPLATWRHYGVAYQPGGVGVAGQTLHAVTLLAVLLFVFWACGELLRLLSRGTFWINAGLFYLVVMDSWFYQMAAAGKIALRHSFGLAILLHALPFKLPAAILLAGLWLGSLRRSRKTAEPLVSAVLIGVALILSVLLTGTESWMAIGFACWSEQAYQPVPYLDRFFSIFAMAWPALAYPLVLLFSNRHERTLAP